MQSDKLFVGIVLVGVMGVALSAIASLIERRFDTWRVAARGQD